ncbi:hypothetical protein [Phorcysia thermohydrogeniphila]|uniref:Uncharacterized protein n=1 Tax=Phorcysia thermohydrogeniphila TaxID=936138 RepID=A0A4R1GLT1_9BACT|nr:hypothetical protein [Phorcysia thermohydrogeniphila]TCK05372.1 hypothetical protein CLV27_0799 [Phorcysia thermohydrogeniphila]
MARGRKPGKRANKVVKLSLPKRIYYVLYGIAGNNEQRMNKLIRAILEEKLENSTLAELASLLETGRREKEEETAE